MSKARSQGAQQPVSKKPPEMKSRMMGDALRPEGCNLSILSIFGGLNMQGISHHQWTAHPQAMQAADKSNHQWSDEVETEYHKPGNPKEEIRKRSISKFTRDSTALPRGFPFLGSPASLEKDTVNLIVPGDGLASSIPVIRQKVKRSFRPLNHIPEPSIFAHPVVA